MDLLSMHTVLRRLTGEFGTTLDYEAILEAQYRKLIQPGAIIIDAGAHAGRHTRVFSELCGPAGHVLAIEPLPQQAMMLREHAFANVEVLELALGDRSAEVPFIHAEGTPEESGLKARVFNHPDRASPRQIMVEMQTLDKIAAQLQRCDYIKMDLEGAELTALRGGVSTLSRLRPVVSVEHGAAGYAVYGHGPDDLRAFAASHGYLMADLLGAPAVTPDEWSLVSGGWMWDFFMVPTERAGPILQVLQSG